MPVTSKPPATQELQCSRCGAVLPADAKACWLCYAPVESATGQSGAKSVAAGRQVPRLVSPVPAGGFSLASLMMFVTLVSVVLGVSTIAPGLGIPLGIVLLVVWLRTAAVARQRAARGLTLSRSETWQLFIASFGTALGLIAVTCVAGSAALVAACFACVFAGEGLGWDSAAGESVAWLLFVIVAGGIALPVLWAIGKLIRRRWRRDIGEAD